MELLHQLRTALSETDDALDAARHDRAELDVRIESLEMERRGLELAIARRNGTAPDANGDTWRRMARTDAVIKILEESDGPLSPIEVTEQLHRHGRDDRRDPVAAALAYLKRDNRVRHVGPAQWTVYKPQLLLEGGDSP